MLYKDPDDQNFAEEIESKMRLHFILTSCHKKNQDTVCLQMASENKY